MSSLFTHSAYTYVFVFESDFGYFQAPFFTNYLIYLEMYL